MNLSESNLLVQESFDSVAGIFDEQYENKVTRRLRSSLYRTIDAVGLRGGSLLDISCGTGIDVLELAGRGYRVTASDLSPNMVERARSKAAALGRGDIQFHVGSMEHLEEIPGAPFDLVLTNFGALNCLQTLRGAARSIAGVTHPGSVLLAVVMPRICPWEITAGLARGDVSAAFRRFRAEVWATGFQRASFKVHYYSLRALRSSFKPWFDFEGARAWCAFSPPPHATRFASQFRRLTRGLEVIDEVVAGLPLVRAVGDHYLCILSRNSERPA